MAEVNPSKSDENITVDQYDLHEIDQGQDQDGDTIVSIDIKDPRTEMNGNGNEPHMDLFGRFLTIWVAICIGIGTVIGTFLPQVASELNKLNYAQINLPIAVLIWIMIFPMMLRIDLGLLKRKDSWKRYGKGLAVTLGVNWLAAPFSMFGFSYIGFKYVFGSILTDKIASEYLAGSVILGVAPCTAMVFVWSLLARGDATYTLLQVAINDIIMIFLFAPLTMLLLGVSSVPVPTDTIFLAVSLFVVIPFALAWLTRFILLKKKSRQWFDEDFLPKWDMVGPIALLLTLILLFIFQGNAITSNPVHILIIAVPMTVSTYVVFAIGFFFSYILHIDFEVAAPGAFIGASNFFELAVAVSIALYGLTSGAALATVVGVLVEVPVMLSLVAIAKKLKSHFPVHTS